ncbi:hypothetical protein [Nostoc sp. C057]|uniref:hypothetical protein n=1 Tax=Nostoc sp. C057 TaxID=2576903 RepID=UPI0015C2EE89|nr:hypothetical protein [Nostoc sp. C057]
MMQKIRNNQGKFTTDRAEARDAKLSLRIEPSVLEKFKRFQVGKKKCDRCSMN